MRDSQVIAHQRELEAGIAHDLTVLRDMNIQCRTRQEALETLLFGSRTACLVFLLQCLFAPRKAAMRLQAEHASVLSRFSTYERAPKSSIIRVVP